MSPTDPRPGMLKVSGWGSVNGGASSASSTRHVNLAVLNSAQIETNSLVQFFHPDKTTLISLLAWHMAKN